MSTSAQHKPRRERLLALVLCGLLAFNYPLLSLFAVPHLVFGIPILYLYLFGTWMGFILACALIVVERGAVGADRTKRGLEEGTGVGGTGIAAKGAVKAHQAPDDALR